MKRRSTIKNNGLLTALLTCVVIVVGAIALIGNYKMPSRFWPSAPMNVLNAPVTSHYDNWTQKEHNIHALKKYGAVVGQAQIESGDTLIVDGKRFRLWGIRAFNYRRSCIDYADESSCLISPANHLRRLAEGRLIACYPQGMGINGDVTATCKREHEDLAGLQVHAGMARAEKRETNSYVGSHFLAKNGKRGYWSSN